jgi:hypothetical protein
MWNTAILPSIIKTLSATNVPAIMYYIAKHYTNINMHTRRARVYLYLICTQVVRAYININIPKSYERRTPTGESFRLPLTRF